MNRRTVAEVVVFVLLVTLSAASRVVEWIPPNFQAIAAASLFAGFFFRSRVVALCVPLFAMMISDALIGGYSRYVMITVYGCLALPIAWRGFLRTSYNPLRVALAAVVSSVVFFVATNLAAWPGLYPHTLEGLGQAYAWALPFFRFTLASDLLYSLSLFGAYAAVVKLAGNFADRREAQATPARAA